MKVESTKQVTYTVTLTEDEVQALRWADSLFDSPRERYETMSREKAKQVLAELDDSFRNAGHEYRSWL